MNNSPAFSINSGKRQHKRILVIGSDGNALFNFYSILLREMVLLGYEVHAIASNENGVSNKLKAIGVIFHPVSINRHSTSIANNIIYFWCLYWKIKLISPDICLAFTIKPVIYGILASTLLRIKKKYSLITGLGYIFISTNIKAYALNRIVRVLYRLAFLFSNKVILLNEDDRNYFCQIKLVKENKTVIINGSGVNLTFFSPSPLPKLLTFIMISRFLPEKGIFEYAEACQKLKKEYPSVRCCLVGYIDNPSAGITENSIETWKKNGIEYLGRLQDVRPAIHEASVFVLPSYREGISSSILEAMAMGRPIITTDEPGCRQTVIANKNGFLVPARNSDALYHAMKCFVLEPHLIADMGKESLKIAQNKFDVNKINDDMLKLLQLK